MDYAHIRKHCRKTANALFDAFDRRKPILADVAREYYPLALPGLTKQVDEINDDASTNIPEYYTTTPIDCLRKSAAGFHGNLTSPHRRWFELRLPSYATDDGTTTHAQQIALDRFTEATEAVFRDSGVYKALAKLYEHLLAFGFGAMIISGDARRVIKAQTLRIGTYALGVGNDGTVCRVVRRFAWTAEQIIREFGDSGVTDDVRECARNGNVDRRWVIYNLIEPNSVGYMREYDRVAKILNLSDDMIYRSVYWLDKATDDAPQSGILGISGFTIEPIVAPRLDFEIGDVYGRGRGVDGLALARGAQTLQADIYRASGNRHQPALIASAEFQDDGLKPYRGAVNYSRLGEQSQSMVAPILQIDQRTQETREDLDRVRNELNDLFFNSAFAAIDAIKTQPGVKTATEVDAIVRENMERLGAIVTNLDHELLDPLVSVVAKYTAQSGISPLSEEDMMLFTNINIVYVSQVHLAQRQASVSAIQNWTGFIANLAQLKPEALDKLNVNETIDEYGKMLGVPAKCVATDEAVEMASQARVAQMQQQQQMAQMQMQAQALRDVGGIPTDADHVGGQVARAVDESATQDDVIGGSIGGGLEI